MSRVDEDIRGMKICTEVAEDLDGIRLRILTELKIGGMPSRFLKALNGAERILGAIVTGLKACGT